MMLALLPLCFAAPLGTLMLALFVFDERHYAWQNALLIATCFAVAFHGLHLTYGNDIVRHMKSLANYSSVSLTDCFGAGYYAGLPTWDIWCWIVAQFGDPFLLQASAAFVGYAIMAYIALDYGAICQASKQTIATALLMTLFAVPFMSIVSGVRSAISMLICALAGYRFCIKQDSLFLVAALCFLAITIHPVALMGSLLIALVPLVSRSPRVRIPIVFLIALASSIIGNTALPTLSSSGNAVLRFLADAISAFLGYSEGNSWTATQASSLNTRVNNAFTIAWLMIICANTLMVHRCQSSEGNRRIEQVVVLILMLAATTIALSMVLEVNGTRLTPMAFSLGSICIIERMVKRPAKEDKSLFVFDACCIIVAVGLLALHIYSVLYSIVDGNTFIMSCFLGVLGR